MHDLAHNVHGDPFEPPANTAGWRVRRIKPRGAPEPVFGHDGLPLVLPLDAGAEDLRRSVSEAGRYRLDPVNDNYHPIEGAPSGYLYVYPHHLRNGAAPNGASSEALAGRDAPSGGMEAALIEMAKVVTTMAQTVVQTMACQFPAMMESAAVLVRAADGAGLPARQPLALANQDQDDDEDEDDDPGPPPAPPPAQGPDLTTALAQVLPAILATFAGKNASTPTAAAPRAQPTPQAPATLAHFLAIQQALTGPERTLSRALVSELPPEPLQAWMTELAALPLPAAIDRVRALLHSEPRQTTTDPSEPAAPPAPSEPAPPAPSQSAAPPARAPSSQAPSMADLSPAAMAHFLAIQQALTGPERALAQALASELPSDHLQAWMAELAAMPVPAAVERVRRLLHGEDPEAEGPKAEDTKKAPAPKPPAPGASGGAS